MENNSCYYKVKLQENIKLSMCTIYIFNYNNGIQSLHYIDLTLINHVTENFDIKISEKFSMFSSASRKSFDFGRKYSPLNSNSTFHSTFVKSPLLHEWFLFT